MILSAYTLYQSLPVHVCCPSLLCRHVRSSLANTVNTNKLALWGTSFAGGHVLVVSSEQEFRDHITAVVTQVSHTGNRLMTEVPISPVCLRLALHCRWCTVYIDLSAFGAFSQTVGCVLPFML